MVLLRHKFLFYRRFRHAATKHSVFIFAIQASLSVNYTPHFYVECVRMVGAFFVGVFYQWMTIRNLVKSVSHFGSMEKVWDTFLFFSFFMNPYQEEIFFESRNAEHG